MIMFLDCTPALGTKSLNESERPFKKGLFCVKTPLLTKLKSHFVPRLFRGANYGVTINPNVYE